MIVHIYPPHPPFVQRFHLYHLAAIRKDATTYRGIYLVFRCLLCKIELISYRLHRYRMRFFEKTLRTCFNFTVTNQPKVIKTCFWSFSYFSPYWTLAKLIIIFPGTFKKQSIITSQFSFGFTTVWLPVAFS